MHYSLNDLVGYVKANWKHVLAGMIAAYVGQHYGVTAGPKVVALLKMLGIG